MRPIIEAFVNAALMPFAIPAEAAAQTPHNVVLFVPDGLRALSVDAQSAPAMAALRDKGVNFKNSHALFPTFTTANASAMATGHYLGDTGDFSNTIYAGFPLNSAAGASTPFLENDAVLGEMDEHFAGDYLDEATLLAAAREAGYGTAAIGKLVGRVIAEAMPGGKLPRFGARTVLAAIGRSVSTGATPRGWPGAASRDRSG